MGYVINEYLIVSGWRDDHINEAHDAAKKLIVDKLVTAIMPHNINRSKTFFVNSSGSKSGWVGAITHNNAIGDFKDWCRKENLFNNVLHIQEFEEIEKSKIVDSISYIEEEQTMTPTQKMTEAPYLHTKQ